MARDVQYGRFTMKVQKEVSHYYFYLINQPTRSAICVINHGWAVAPAVLTATGLVHEKRQILTPYRIDTP